MNSLICASVVLGVGLLTALPVGAQPVNDPFEATNREIFDFNVGVDQVLLRPVSRGYRSVVPDPARSGISNVLKNLSEPKTLINNVLQGDATAAWNTFIRFAVNTTIGLGGLFDITTAGNFERRREDFGQTLAVWGVGGGPYVMLPLIGPSTGRDTVGFVVDTATDPFSLLLGFTPSVARTGARIINSRSENLEEFDTLQATSLDFYASIRTLYLQNREYEIRNGAPPPLADIYEDVELEKDVQVIFPSTQSE